MSITPAGKYKIQVNQGCYKNESIFDNGLDGLLQKIAVTGTNVAPQEPQETTPEVPEDLQQAAASPQLTDPGRNMPDIETKKGPKRDPNVNQAPQQGNGYPPAPGSVEALPPTQRGVAELLIQKAMEQGLISEGFQPKINKFDFSDGNSISISIVNGAGRVRPESR